MNKVTQLQDTVEKDPKILILFHRTDQFDIFAQTWSLVCSQEHNASSLNSCCPMLTKRPAEAGLLLAAEALKHAEDR